MSKNYIPPFSKVLAYIDEESLCSASPIGGNEGYNIENEGEWDDED